MATVKVVTEDGTEFPLTEDRARQLAMVWNAYTDLGCDPKIRIPLPSVTKATFEAINRFLITPGADLEQILKVGKVSLKDILLASQFLQASALCEAISRVVVRHFFEGLAIPADKSELTEEQKRILEKMPSFD